MKKVQGQNIAGPQWCSRWSSISAHAGPPLMLMLVLRGAHTGPLVLMLVLSGAHAGPPLVLTLVLH